MCEWALLVEVEETKEKEKRGEWMGERRGGVGWVRLSMVEYGRRCVVGCNGYMICVSVYACRKQCGSRKRRKRERGVMKEKERRETKKEKVDTKRAEDRDWKEGRGEGEKERQREREGGGERKETERERRMDGLDMLDDVGDVDDVEGGWVWTGLDGCGQKSIFFSFACILTHITPTFLSLSCSSCRSCMVHVEDTRFYSALVARSLLFVCFVAFVRCQARERDRADGLG